MKICLIAEGLLPIPPKGWGGVEHLLWNFQEQLTKLGDDVKIINTTNLKEIIEIVNSNNFDVVHLHYDQYAKIMQHLNCNKKFITSHYPYLENPEPNCIFLYDLLKNSGSHIISLSNRIKIALIKQGIPEENISVLPCGIETKKYSIDLDDILYPDRSVIVGKIEPRKRQFDLQHKNLNIDFIGNNSDPRFDASDSHYYGEQDKKDIMENLTSYANMILLSKGEAHPFVCLEALSSGLGLVISEESSANLDITKPFISVIPNDKLYDYDFLKKEIQNNRKISLKMRKEIRQYCFENFDWSVIIKRYKHILKTIK